MNSDITQQRRPVLEVEDLHVRFVSRGAEVKAVTGVSFTLHAGEIIALVGESGSGKSVTARTLVGLAGDNAEVSAQRLALTGDDAPGGGEIDLRHQSQAAWRKIRGRKIGFVLQDALSSLDPLRRIGQEIAEPLLTHRLASRRDIPDQVNALLNTVGIPDPVNRAKMYPHELSGGLRQRALIASALAGQPAVLIADEPTTALDATIQKQILEEFRALASLGIGIVLITHDLSVVADIADSVIVMQHGKPRESGTVHQVLNSPQDPYTKKLLSSVPTRHSRGTWLTGHDPLPDVSLPATSVSTKSDKLDTVLSVNNVSRSFRLPNGEKLPAVDNVSLTLNKGETLGIVGESGSGKTTLGKLILALQTPEAGEIHLLNQPWSRLKERQRRVIRPRIQTIVQDPLSSFDPQYTVEQVLLQPLELHSTLTAAQKKQRVIELLSLVSLDRHLLTRRPASLSGGQRQRVSIAQALACQPDILVCDEPVSALDVTTQAQVLDLLYSLQQKLGLAIVFISHDLGVVQHISHRIIILKSGKVVETGSVEQIFTQPQHPYTKQLVAI